MQLSSAFHVLRAIHHIASNSVCVRERESDSIKKDNPHKPNGSVEEFEAMLRFTHAGCLRERVHEERHCITAVRQDSGDGVCVVAQNNHHKFNDWWIKEFHKNGNSFPKICQ